MYVGVIHAVKDKAWFVKQERERGWVSTRLKTEEKGGAEGKGMHWCRQGASLTRQHPGHLAALVPTAQQDTQHLSRLHSRTHSTHLEPLDSYP